jgi:hypothetical protein
MGGISRPVVVYLGLKMGVRSIAVCHSLREWQHENL